MEERITECRNSKEEQIERMAGMESAFLPDRKRKKFAELEEKTAQPGFWNDREAAQLIVKQMNEIKPMLGEWSRLENLRDEVVACLELLEEAEDKDILTDLEKNQALWQKALNDFELALLLNEPYDAAPAIVSIHPGAGGTESQDWAEMLGRMYTRFAELEGYKCEVLDRQPGDVAGIKSLALRFEGFFAYGYLKCERGVHRLVRISPFDANARRHTSFVSVDVSPEVEEADEVEVEEKDLKIDTFRASGAGGQHVNKTESAIRITHLPTGFVVQCQNERSQHSNKATAMKMLKSKLYVLEQQKRDEELAKLSGNKLDIAWGSQIRNYVFHPYQLVKDLRTSHEVGNIQSVMDGDVMPFIESYLRHRSQLLAERSAD